MNLYDYSKENNFEIAYKITSLFEAKELAKNVIMGEIFKVWTTDSLRGRYMAELENGEFEPGKPKKKPIPQANANVSAPANRRHGEAFCIRCRAGIPANANTPLCPDDYEVWSQFKNFDYVESYCHKCGKPSETTMGRPLCYDCYREENGRLTM